MAQQGSDVDTVSPNPCVVDQLVDRVGDLETFTQEFRNNLRVLRLDQHNRIFTLAHLDTEQLLNISSNTLQNWLGRRSHDYVELQNLNLIIQNITASNFEGLVIQYAISRARDVLFAIKRAKHYAPNCFNYIIVCPLWAKLGKYHSETCRKNAVMKRKDNNCVGILSYQEEAATASSLSEYTTCNNSNSDLVESHSTSPLTNSQST